MGPRDKREDDKLYDLAKSQELNCPASPLGGDPGKFCCKLPTCKNFNSTQALQI